MGVIVLCTIHFLSSFSMDPKEFKIVICCSSLQMWLAVKYICCTSFFISAFSLSLSFSQRVVGHMDKKFAKSELAVGYYFSHAVGKKELKNRVQFQVCPTQHRPCDTHRLHQSNPFVQGAWVKTHSTLSYFGYFWDNVSVNACMSIKTYTLTYLRRKHHWVTCKIKKHCP